MASTDFTLKQDTLAAHLSKQIMLTLDRGTDPNHAGYWGSIGDRDQRIVEAADIAITIFILRDSLWLKLTPPLQQRILMWLEQVSGKEIPDNNWHLFVALILTTVANLRGHTVSQEALEHVNRFMTFYVGDGWFSDYDPALQPTLDYYNAFQIHYSLWWLNQIAPGNQFSELCGHTGQFAETLFHLTTTTGFPMVGRSICYRLAFPTAPKLHSLTTPSFQPSARAMLDCIWVYFLSNGAICDGAVTQGWTTSDQSLLDTYSGPASPLWGTRALVAAFMMPKTSQFWTSQPAKLPIELGDYVIDLPSARITIRGTHLTNEVTISRIEGFKQIKLLSMEGIKGLARHALAHLGLRGRRLCTSKAYTLETYSSKD